MIDYSHVSIIPSCGLKLSGSTWAENSIVADRLIDGIGSGNYDSLGGGTDDSTNEV